MTEEKSAYLNHLGTVAAMDVSGLLEAERHYGNSCLRRGGVGLFMMFARKWDRLENAAQKVGYDLFKAYENDHRKEGLLDDIRDLRRYLMLAEAELMARYKNDFSELTKGVDVSADPINPLTRNLQGVEVQAVEVTITAQDIKNHLDAAEEPLSFGYVNQDGGTEDFSSSGVPRMYWLLETKEQDGKAERFWDDHYNDGCTVVTRSEALPPGVSLHQRYLVKKAF